MTDVGKVNVVSGEGLVISGVVLKKIFQRKWVLVYRKEENTASLASCFYQNPPTPFN